LTTKLASSPIIPPHSAPTSQQLISSMRSDTINRSTSSFGTSASTPGQSKLALKQSRGPSPAPVYSQPTSGRLQSQPQLHAPVPMYPQPPNGQIGNRNNTSFPNPNSASQLATATPVASTYGRDNANSLSSTHRSSNNHSAGTEGYNVTQSDLTLEGLAQRWHAYQAMMKKRYTEVPFYRRWTKSKWILLFSTLLLLGYSCAVLTVSLGYTLESKLLSKAN